MTKDNTYDFIVKDVSRTDVINYYLSIKEDPVFYLEIGVRNPICNFNKIRATHKDGVDIDPSSKCNFTMTSNRFFEINTTKYDVIFIDGDHRYEQAHLDVLNSLSSLKPNGIIIMHDCNPPNELCQKVPLQTNGPWTGTVWKAFIKLRRERKDLKMFVIDDDFGIGVIDPSKTQETFSCSDDIYEYKNFCKVRQQALNLMSSKEWKETR